MLRSFALQYLQGFTMSIESIKVFEFIFYYLVQCHGLKAHPLGQAN